MSEVWRKLIETDDGELAKCLSLARVSISKQTGNMQVRLNSTRLLSSVESTLVEGRFAGAFPAVKVETLISYPELGERGGAVPVLAALGAVGGGVGGSGQADPCGAGGFVPFLAAVAGSLEKFEFAEPGELRIVHFQDFVAIFQHVYFNFPKFALLL